MILEILAQGQKKYLKPLILLELDMLAWFFGATLFGGI